jgi:hypothetical protein
VGAHRSSWWSAGPCGLSSRDSWSDTSSNSSRRTGFWGRAVGGRATVRDRRAASDPRGLLPSRAHGVRRPAFSPHPSPRTRARSAGRTRRSRSSSSKRRRLVAGRCAVRAQLDTPRHAALTSATREGRSAERLPHARAVRRQCAAQSPARSAICADHAPVGLPSGHRARSLAARDADLRRRAQPAWSAAPAPTITAVPSPSWAPLPFPLQRGAPPRPVCWRRDARAMADHVFSCVHRSTVCPAAPPRRRSLRRRCFSILWTTRGSATRCRTTVGGRAGGRAAVGVRTRGCCRH